MVVIQSIIDPSVLTELGKMYTTISQTLRELVQNGFDSYANNVYIEIDIPKNQMTVVDDGVGMNDYVVLNHYANVGMSTKKKEMSEFPKVSSNLNTKRPKIGKKGMGKLSWILMAKKQETITSCIDIPYSIKINFDANNLKEFDEPTHITKHTDHGTKVVFKELQITDIKQEDIDEFINTTGFLHTAFSEFNIYLTVRSPTTNITNQKIVKVLAEGYQFNTTGNHVYKEIKYVNGKINIIREENIPYGFMFRLPAAASRGSSEFWLLSGYMGIKKLYHFQGFSGYLNIDNIELIANRNDIQTGEQEKYTTIENVVSDYLIDQLEKMYLNENKKASDVLIYLDGNQESIIDMIYRLDRSSKHAKQIAKYFKFDFYGQGLKRLTHYFNSENVIYHYTQENKTAADKATYYGYKCFHVSGYNAEYSVEHAFDTSFIQNITALPKEAYATSGSTVKPVGNLTDILKNIGNIFNSLSYAYSKVTSRVDDLKRELEERADSLTDKEKEEKRKELEELLKRQNEAQKQLDTGSEESGEVDEFEDEHHEGGKRKTFKKQKEKAFKQSDDHYMEMKFDKYEMKVGFAYFDDEKVVANIYMQHFIHLNLNNEWIKSAIKYKNPLRQLMLLTPHICHEVSHLWTSEHDEIFQMVNNMLLIPTLDHLLRQLGDDTTYETTPTSRPTQQPTTQSTTPKKPIRKIIRKIAPSKIEDSITKSFEESSKKADDILQKLKETDDTHFE